MKKILFNIFLLFAALSVNACQENDNPVITFVHTNDTHSQIDPSTGQKKEGGLVERAALLELLRQEDPSLIYVDAGDMVQGSPYFNIYKGEVEILAMNLQGLEASTMGNHEFDNGLDGLAQMYEAADFPILSCNYDCEGTPLEHFIIRKMIIERNGVKIGMSGVTCNPYELIYSKNWAGIKYLDPSEEANKVAAELREEGCDLVVILSHVGYFESDTITGDRKIALQSKDIDLIIGGHTHTNLEDGVCLENTEGKPVWITQTGGRTNPMGRVQITMQRAKDKTRKYEIKDVVIDKIKPNKYDCSKYGHEMKDFIMPYTTSMTEKMGTVIGTAAETMERKRPQSLLGNFVADAYMELGKRYYGKKMDCAMMNVGGMRSDLDKGDITIGSMYRIFPFENTLAIIEIKGEYLSQLLKSLAGRKLEAMAGVNITLQTTNDKTVATKILVGGKPIDPKRIYYIATIDYLSEGNDGFHAFLNAEKITNTGITLRDLMTEYIKELTQEGRIVESKLDDRVIDL